MSSACLPPQLSCSICREGFSQEEEEGCLVWRKRGVWRKRDVRFGGRGVFTEGGKRVFVKKRGVFTEGGKCVFVKKRGVVSERGKDV